MDEPAVNHAATFHGARAALYSYVAELFTYPSREVVDDLQAAEVSDAVEIAGKTIGFEVTVNALVEALTTANGAKLADEYNRLFGVPLEDGSYTIPPYEAYYTIGDDIGQQQRRIATVVGLMEAIGVEPNEEFHERWDHLVAELELMQLLAARRALAIEDADDDTTVMIESIEGTVLDEHLIDFVPAFAHDVRKESDDPVYVTAANLVERLVKRDHDAYGASRPATTTGDSGRLLS